MSMTAQQLAQEAALFASAVSPLLPPNVQLAIALGQAAFNAVQQAVDRGHDVTEAELDALFSADDQAKIDDLLVQQEAKK